MHNGQQPTTHRNLGNCQGKAQCGETKREREILLFCFRKIQNSINNTFSAKRNTSYSTKLSPTNLSWKPCHSPYNCTDLLKFDTLKFVPQQVVVPSLLYGCPPSKNSSRMPRKSCPILPRFSCLKNDVVRPVRICTIRPVPANNTAANQNRKKPPWDLRPSSLGNRALVDVHFPLSSNLSTSPLVFSSVSFSHP